MKIGIVTYHRSHNYGAFLQAYALSNFLIEHGYDAEIIDISSKKAQNYYKKQIFIYGIGQLLNEIKKYRMFEKNLSILHKSNYNACTDDVERFRGLVYGKYDVIVSGSDEVWKIGFRGFPNQYWLPGDFGCIKMAYAVSSRNNLNDFSDEQKEMMEEYISDFRYIGVRDNDSYNNILETNSNKCNIHKNCDPIYLHDFKQSSENGKEILKLKFGINTSKKTIALMIGNKNLSHQIVSRLKSEFGDRYNYIALYFNHDKLLYYSNCTPFDWINVIAASDFLLTTYFHGTCFAIKSNVPFLTVECRKGNEINGKNYDMLSENKMIDRFAHIKDEDLLNVIVNKIKTDIDNEFDFSDVCKMQYEKSRSFLEGLGDIDDARKK